MDERFPQRKKNRLQGYDYSRDGYYFVTICVKKEPFCFGEVRNGKMRLNAYGLIAEAEWWDMIHRYPYAICPAVVVMPDHVHGIIGIHRARMKKVLDGAELPKVKSLSSLVASFKMRVSKRIHLEGHHAFRWQKSFYDHIIRTERSLWNIIDYIERNPLEH